MAKIYLAAMYNQMNTMHEHAMYLELKGHTVTAQWVEGKESDDLEKAAIMDVEDVKRADTVISFSQPRGSFNSGGGRHVEFGIGLILGKRMIVVGPKGEHVFHSYPGVEFYNTLQEAEGSL